MNLLTTICLPSPILDFPISNFYLNKNFKFKHGSQEHNFHIFFSLIIDSVITLDAHALFLRHKPRPILVA
ncbi:hypothetical protein T02_4209 [Trichinella nativa]|uniref:Uncharacterized protein n=1 Tax=Trichinella nativa TaxID=6335 RepID=A0A0V1KYY6_9BILA|nr:hypothetical protein T02_4209 [Trichinella nativa]